MKVLPNSDVLYDSGGGAIAPSNYSMGLFATLLGRPQPKSASLWVKSAGRLRSPAAFAPSSIWRRWIIRAISLRLYKVRTLQSGSKSVVSYGPPPRTEDQESIITSARLQRSDTCVAGPEFSTGEFYNTVFVTTLSPAGITFTLEVGRGPRP
jgi:hypothetical protein